jgi:hypothetical protein
MASYGVPANSSKSDTASKSCKSLSSSVCLFNENDVVIGAHYVIKEDEKVSLEELQEKIAEFEDYVQSSDVAAMQSKCFCKGAPFELTAYFSTLEL